MEMQCKFNLQSTDVQLQIPPNWTYGTMELVEVAFASLSPMAIERSQLMDCVVNWLNGLLSKFVKKEGHLWGFQRAKYALIELQISQEESLRRLDAFRKRIKQKWGPSRLKRVPENWSSDREESACDDDESTYDNMYLPRNADDYLARRRAAFKGDQNHQKAKHGVAKKRSFSQRWKWDNRFVLGLFDERDFWENPNTWIRDSYIVKWREDSVDQT